MEATRVNPAALAYLGRYTGFFRAHSESDLRIFFVWCQDRELVPLAAGEPYIVKGNRPTLHAQHADLP
ncbi:hypothetical protein [Amycolatopsis sp. NPDC052450]|uniref:hypothetical protein n=1 Tax=Amycolatopsis sp. NPDC052450 TaxID=3363937 RepID=UPI0037C51784